MALRLRHWIAVAALVCATIAVAKLPPRESTRRFGGGRTLLPEQTALLRVQRQLTRANENLILLEKRDSLLRLVGRGRSPRETDVVLLVDPQLPPAVRTVMRRVVEGTWQKTAPHHDAITVAVAVVVDTVRRPRDLPRANRNRIRLAHFLPQATDQGICLALVSLGANVARRIAHGLPVTPSTLIGRYGIPGGPAAILGPCGFYGAFGESGPELTRWLESSDYHLSLHSDWSGMPQPLEFRRGRWRWRWFWFAADFDFVACAAGQPERCRAVAFPTATERDPFLGYRRGRWSWSSALRGVAGSSGMLRWMTHPLGMRARSYLADMVAEFGRDRFARFWSSELPVDSAFVQAMGIPLEEWTMRWAQAQIGTPRAGPGTGVLSVVLSLFVAGVFVGAGAWLVTRRQVW